MGILGRCLCPSLVYEIAGLEAGSYCSGPGERRRAFRLGFWLQRQKDYVCVLKPAVFVDETLFRMKCDFDLQKIQIGQQKFIPFYIKSPARLLGLLLPCCPGNYGLHFQAHLLAQNGQCSSSHHIYIPCTRKDPPKVSMILTLIPMCVCFFSTPNFSKVSCVFYNSILTQSTWRYYQYQIPQLKGSVLQDCPPLQTPVVSPVCFLRF